MSLSESQQTMSLSESQQTMSLSESQQTMSLSESQQTMSLSESQQEILKGLRNIFKQIEGCIHGYKNSIHSRKVRNESNEAKREDSLDYDCNESSDTETVVVKCTFQDSKTRARRNKDFLGISNVNNTASSVSDNDSCSNSSVCLQKGASRADDRNESSDNETVIIERDFKDSKIRSRRNGDFVGISNVNNTASSVSDNDSCSNSTVCLRKGASRADDRNESSDTETVILERTFRDSKIRSRRNRDFLANSNVYNTASSVFSNDSCSTSTVCFRKGTGRPEDQPSQMIEECNSYRVKGGKKEVTKKTTAKFVPMNSQHPLVLGNKSKHEPLSIGTFKVPINHSHSEAKLSDIQSTKRKTKIAMKPTAVKGRKEELHSSRLMDSSTLPSKRMGSLMANCNITIIPIGTSISHLPRQLTSEVSITLSPQKKMVKPAIVPEVNAVMIIDLTRETSPPPVDSTQETNPPRKRLRRAPEPRSSQVYKEKLPPLVHRVRGTNNLLRHICEYCTAQYPTKDKLQVHKQIYHVPGGLSLDMAVSIADLGKPENLSKLQALGFQYMIPVTPQPSKR